MVSPNDRFENPRSLLPTGFDPEVSGSSTGNSEGRRRFMAAIRRDAGTLGSSSEPSSPTTTSASSRMSDFGKKAARILRLGTPPPIDKKAISSPIRVAWDPTVVYPTTRQNLNSANGGSFEQKDYVSSIAGTESAQSPPLSPPDRGDLDQLSSETKDPQDSVRPSSDIISVFLAEPLTEETIPMSDQSTSSEQDVTQLSVPIFLGPRSHTAPPDMQGSYQGPAAGAQSSPSFFSRRRISPIIEERSSDQSDRSLGRRGLSRNTQESEPGHSDQLSMRHSTDFDLSDSAGSEESCDQDGNLSRASDQPPEIYGGSVSAEIIEASSPRERDGMSDVLQDSAEGGRR